MACPKKLEDEQSLETLFTSLRCRGQADSGDTARICSVQMKPVGQPLKLTQDMIAFP